ncbi:hypothetical protein B0H13DRAFT_1865986 [Mycena leptocephala]|nr:hypothetical protein B0H13DRAFT_1865986 [Mycena leptocephala]
MFLISGPQYRTGFRANGPLQGEKKVVSLTGTIGVQKPTIWYHYARAVGVHIEGFKISGFGVGEEVEVSKKEGGGSWGTECSASLVVPVLLTLDQSPGPPPTPPLLLDGCELDGAGAQLWPWERWLWGGTHYGETVWGDTDRNEGPKGTEVGLRCADGKLHAKSRPRRLRFTRAGRPASGMPLSRQRQGSASSYAVWVMDPRITHKGRAWIRLGLGVQAVNKQTYLLAFAEYFGNVESDVAHEQEATKGSERAYTMVPASSRKEAWDATRSGSAGVGVCLAAAGKMAGHVLRKKSVLNLRVFASDFGVSAVGRLRVIRVQFYSWLGV